MTHNPGFRVTVLCNCEYFNTVHLSNCGFVYFYCNVPLTRGSSSSAIAELLVIFLLFFTYKQCMCDAGCFFHSGPKYGRLSVKGVEGAEQHANQNTGQESSRRRVHLSASEFLPLCKLFLLHRVCEIGKYFWGSLILRHRRTAAPAEVQGTGFWNYIYSIQCNVLIITRISLIGLVVLLLLFAMFKCFYIWVIL